MKTPLVCLLLLTGCTTAVIQPSSSPAPATPVTIDVADTFAALYPDETIVANAKGDIDSSFTAAILSLQTSGFSNHLHIMDEDGLFQSIVIGDACYYEEEDGFTVDGNTISFTLREENDAGKWDYYATTIEVIKDEQGVHWKNIQKKIK